MKIKNISLQFLICGLLPIVLSCPVFAQDNEGDVVLKNNSESAFFYSVEEAPEWTKLFHRTSGWIGADGVFSIPLVPANEVMQGEKKVLFVFSDTMIGKVRNGELQKGSTMVNNSIAYLEGNNPDTSKITFYPDKGNKKDIQTLFIPHTEHSQKGDYYWLGDGFSHSSVNGNIYVFAYRMRNMSNKEWSFKQVGNVLLILEQKDEFPFYTYRQVETPFYIEGEEEIENSSLGAGVFANIKSDDVPHPDGYIYVYGVRGEKKDLIVARVLPENFENFEKWRFWNEGEWEIGIHQASTITDSVSNELSVTPLTNGKYALIFQINGMSDAIGLRLGSTPYGPFGPIFKVWTCPEAQQENYFTYNAKAHPALSRKGELIISYNVNAFDFFEELNKNPTLYRPRFLRLKYK